MYLHLQLVSQTQVFNQQNMLIKSCRSNWNTKFVTVQQVGRNFMLSVFTALINFSWSSVPESSKNKILSILIAVEVCKTILKSGFDFLVTSVHILASYFRQTVCKEILEKSKWKDRWYGKHILQFCSYANSKQGKAKKIKVSCACYEKTKAQAFVDV